MIYVNISGLFEVAGNAGFDGGCAGGQRANDQVFEGIISQAPGPFAGVSFAIAVCEASAVLRVSSDSRASTPAPGPVAPQSRQPKSVRCEAACRRRFQGWLKSVTAPPTHRFLGPVSELSPLILWLVNHTSVPYGSVTRAVVQNPLRAAACR